MGSGEGSAMKNFIVCTGIVRVIISRRSRWIGLLVRMEEGRSSLKILTREPIGRKPSGGPRRRWDLIYVNRCQYEELGWFGSGLGLLESPCVCDIEPPCSISHGVIHFISHTFLRLLLKSLRFMLRPIFD